MGSKGMEVSRVTVKDVFLEADLEECYRRALLEGDCRPYFEAIARGGSADIINLLFPIPYTFLQVIYKASDMVLANSIREPFGLVWLEAMATGAVVFTGCSGEDYAPHLYNAIVLDAFSAKEITFYIDYLRTHPEHRQAISAAARRTAEQWTWEEVAKRLVCKLEYQAQVQGATLPFRATAPKPRKGAGEVARGIFPKCGV